MFVNAHKFKGSEIILPNTKTIFSYSPFVNVHLETRIIYIGAELIDTVLNFQTFFPGPLTCSYTKNIIMTCNSTAFYKSFVNENAVFRTLFRYVRCFKLYTDTLNVSIPPIFAEKLFFEHFVLDLCRYNAFAPLCFDALGLTSFKLSINISDHNETLKT